MGKCVTRTLLSALAVIAVALPISGSAIAAAPPVNDDFANATVITALPFTDELDSTMATVEAGEPACGDPPEIQSVWYAYSPPTDGILSADLSASSFSTTSLAVFEATGPGLAGLNLIACPIFNYRAILEVRAGSLYYFRAATFPFDPGGIFRFKVQVVLPPPNDNFANAEPVTSLPFDATVDVAASTVEPGEPEPPFCYSTGGKSAWYAFRPTRTEAVTVSAANDVTGAVVYAGDSLSNLSFVGCSGHSFRAEAEQTYYIQVLPLPPPGVSPLQLHIDVTLPVVYFGIFPGDPSIFESVSFLGSSFDPAGSTIVSETWDFGDGSSATGCCPLHRYKKDGTYRVTLTARTEDGRSASAMREILVETHNVAVASLMTPASARAGQTREVLVGISNDRYVETVEVLLLRAVGGGDFEPVGVMTETVPTQSRGVARTFTFTYAFTQDDASAGRVTFQAVATIIGFRDARPANNLATAKATTVKP